MRRLLIFLMPLLVLTSCHTNKKAAVPQAPVVLQNTDSVRVEKIVETVYVPVRVPVPVPQQSVSNIVEADTSHIETDVAESNAWIRPDGTLYHDLINKEVKLSGEAYVPQTTERTNTDAERIREVPVPQPYPVEVERSLTLMEQIKLASFYYLLTALVATLAYTFRRPLLKALRKLIRLD